MQVAEPSAAPAQLGPREEPATQGGSKKKHHLLRHELTAEAQAAAVAHFGAESVDEAAHKVWGLKCVPRLGPRIYQAVWRLLRASKGLCEGWRRVVIVGSMYGQDLTM